MTAENSKGISVDIMGKQHVFACPADQEEDLRLAAANLDEMFKEIVGKKDSSHNERSLLVAALNLSYQLMMANRDMDKVNSTIDKLVHTLSNEAKK